jgi:hypothetical protein
MTYDFVTGDTGNFLRVAVKRKDGTPLVLTGSTARLRWEDADGLPTFKQMTVVDAVNGIVEYNFTGTDLYAPVMVFEVEITDAGEKVLTGVELIQVTVRPQIG